MLQFCDICHQFKDITILHRVVEEFCLFNINSLNERYRVSESCDLIETVSYEDASKFLLNALQFAKREKVFNQENKQLLNDVCVSLLNINKYCKRICFGCFFKELKIVCDERNNLESRVGDLERVVYQQGESSRSQGNYLNNTDTMMTLVDHARKIIINQERVIKNQSKLQLETNKTKKNVKKIGEKEKQLEIKITNLEQNQQTLWDKVFSKKGTSHNIYDFDTYYHWIGWYVFVVFAGYIARKVYRIKTKKRKESKNYLVEIRKIFQEWQLNMYASTGAYVAGFFLIQQAIAKWINPRISGWLLTQKAITITAVSLLVGIGFYLDGIITSSLKTPLQRLGIRIENANIEEKTKKSLLSQTQQVSELFKETLKRFGLLAVVGILTKLIEAYWNKDILSYLSYAVPILGAVKIIWEVDKTLKKLKLGGSKGN